jgi:O-6-methylguanine DNA methyltransferase
MVCIAAGQNKPWWFGVAWEDESIVATATGPTHERAIEIVEHCIPDSVEAAFPDTLPDFFARTIEMLGELERGNETRKSYTLSTRYRSKQMWRILGAAAKIPIGFVTTYGNIALAVESEARAVGQAMATNPLYPIVPCHRVIGADMALVGYGGKQDKKALTAKLGRLEAERRGAKDAIEISVPHGAFTAIPVERVIEAALAHRERRERKRLEKEAREAADRLQQSLF